MKKILFPLLILVITQITVGQKYSRLLNNSGWCCELFSGTGAVYSEYYISGTSTIDDQTYMIINHTYFFQEDSLTQQVWYLNDGEKELIYDFSLELEDTFRIELYDTIVGSYVVSKIDTIETLSGNRKRMILYLTDSLTIETGTLDRDLIWIEGIGSTYGPVYPKTLPVDNEIGGWGTCLEGVYSIDREQVYQGYCTYIGGYWPDQCKFISSKVAQIKKKPFIAYFNALGDLEIFTEDQMESLNIYDLNGRLVLSYMNKLSGQNLIISNQLPMGIYICEIFLKTNEKSSIKLIKYIKSP